MTVTFFGHSKKEYNFNVENKLTEMLEMLIKKGADEFLMDGE